MAYDSGAMTNAARVWFILQYFGVPCVILNGGWPVLGGERDRPPRPPGHAIPRRNSRGSRRTARSAMVDPVRH